MEATQQFEDYQFSDPLAAQDSFANTFDLNNPQLAASNYARIMHEHTKRQLQIATSSATRRSSSGNASSTTSPSLSTQSSVDSSE